MTLYVSLAILIISSISLAPRGAGRWRDDSSGVDSCLLRRSSTAVGFMFLFGLFSEFLKVSRWCCCSPLFGHLQSEGLNVRTPGIKTRWKLMKCDSSPGFSIVSLCPSRPSAPGTTEGDNRDLIQRIITNRHTWWSQIRSVLSSLFCVTGFVYSPGRKTFFFSRTVNTRKLKVNMWNYRLKWNKHWC